MSQTASAIDVNNMLNIAQRRCDDFGVSLKYDHQVATAMSNGKTITLPTVGQPITQERSDTMYGFIIHECGHHQRNEAFDILNAAKPPDHVCAIFNIVEDDGMERELANQWLGDKKALSTMNTILVEKVAQSFDDAVAAGNDIDNENNPPEPLATMCLGRLASLDWDKDNDLVTKRLIDAMPTRARELLFDLVDEGWVERFRGTTDPHISWDVTIDLVKRLYPNHDEQQLEEMRADGHSMEANQATRDVGKDETPVEAGEQEGYTVSWKDVVLSEHNQWQSRDPSKGGFGIDFTGASLDEGVQLMPTNLVNVLDLSKSTSNNNYGSSRYMPTDENSRAFANRVRRYIQSKARSTVTKEKYHGRIDRGALVRVVLPPIEGGEYNKRIFYDQRKHTMKDTAIFVLTDWSGSMHGRKMKYAADASQRLVHTFDRVLKVPVALACFSNAKTECDIGYIKKFNARGTTAEAIADRFNDFDRYSSANNDADSVNWAWHELLKRKESRKLLIVLSDGCPAGSWGRSYGDDNLRYITSTIEKDGRVELYGVGICSDAVTEYYTNVKVLKSPSEINDTLFNIIKEGNNA